MNLTTPSFSALQRPTTSSTPTRHPAAQPAQTPLFAGDAAAIRKKLLANAQEAEEAKQKENALRAICDTVVWEGVIDGKQETLTVADMLAFLCRVRPENNSPPYHGFATVETLVAAFPGIEINVKALKTGFDKLHNNAQDPCYVGKNQGVHWLRPDGLNMLQRLYPDIPLPPEEECATPSSRVIQ